MTKKTTKESPSSNAEVPAKPAKPAKKAKPAKEKAATTAKSVPGSKVAPAAKAVKEVKPTDEAGPAVSARKTVAASGVFQIKLVRSLIGSSPHQRAVVAGLGLRRINQIVTRQDTREIRGMVAKVAHLVNVLA